MSEKTERGLRNYNKRKDYGEIDSQTKIAKDDTVIHFEDKHRIWLVELICVVEKRIKKGNKIHTTTRDFKFETCCSENTLVTDEGLIKRASKQGEVSEKEVLIVKEIKRIKPIGLVK